MAHRKAPVYFTVQKHACYRFMVVRINETESRVQVQTGVKVLVLASHKQHDLHNRKCDQILPNIRQMIKDTIAVGLWS